MVFKRPSNFFFDRIKAWALLPVFLRKKLVTKIEPSFNCWRLEELGLTNKHHLTKAQIEELQKALPKCKIQHNSNKQIRGNGATLSSLHEIKIR